MPFTAEEPPHAITVGDVYYVVFRHKWKIIICSALGLVAAVAAYFLKPPLYYSEAKLFIRYVMDSKSLSSSRNASESSSRMKSPDERGENIISSEVEILTSMDLSQQVAGIIGAEKVLVKAGGGNDATKAAWLIQTNLIVEVPKKSNVIHLVFQHPNPEMPQTVLSEVVNSYFKKHVEVHRAPGVLDSFLMQQTDQLRSQLTQTEQELRQAQNKAGVTSLEESKKNTTELIAKVRTELFQAEVELAEHRAALKNITEARKNQPTVNVPTGTPPSSGVMDAYKDLQAQLDQLYKQQQAMLTQFTEENERVKGVREQIAKVEALRKKYEADHPDVLKQSQTVAGIDPQFEAAKVASLESRIATLKEQLEQVRGESSKLEAMESPIVELNRKKELEEANYRYFSANLEQSRFDEALGAVKFSNIGLVQSPSPPSWNPMKTFKMMAMVLFGGVFIGLLWAFLIEMVFDHSLKRAIEVKTRLGMHLLLSIPDIGRNKAKRLVVPKGKRIRPLAPAWAHSLFKAGRRPVKTERGQADKIPAMEAGEDEAKSWNCDPILRPFYEALRDRLVVYFDVRNIHHKPKLIAITGVSNHSGATLTAVGLAASLSETGDGNVLLVDMHPQQEAVQNFYKGKVGCELSHALSTKDNAMVQDNLYVVSHGGSDGGKLPQIFPKQFASMMPELKASDYDYIIFDMPMVTQTSVTPRLAGLMDMVIMVIEAEKTDRDIIRQAHALLLESNANVCAVLNKTRTYVPAWLHQDFLSET